MRFKTFLIFLVLLAFLTFNAFARGESIRESDQQINDFSLAGFGEKGKKTWDLSAQSADIFPDIVKLKNIVGNLYTEGENIKLTGDKGDFNKREGRVHLEENVVITTSSGAKLTTNSLDWDRKNQLVTTKDLVNIERGNILTIAQGATGEPNLSKMTLEKEVTVKINPQIQEEKPGVLDKNKIVITCDGPLEIDYEKNIATFNNNVKVDMQDAQICSDKMYAYFVMSDTDTQGTSKTDQATNAMMGNKIEKIIARGNVRIIRGENISYSDEATYTATNKKIVLTGSPRLIIYSTQGDFNASSGN